MGELTSICNLFTLSSEEPKDLHFIVLDVTRTSGKRALNKAYRLLVTDEHCQTNLVHLPAVGEFIGSNCTAGKYLVIPKDSWEWIQLPSEGKAIQITSPFIQCEIKVSSFSEPTYHYGIGPNVANLPRFDKLPLTTEHSEKSDSSEQDDSLIRARRQRLEQKEEVKTQRNKLTDHVVEYTSTYTYYFKQPQLVVGNYKCYNALDLKAGGMLVQSGARHEHKELGMVTVLAIIRNSRGRPFAIVVDEREVLHRITPKQIGTVVDDVDKDVLAAYRDLVIKFIKIDSLEKTLSQIDGQPQQVTPVDQVEPSVPIQPTNNTNVRDMMGELTAVVQVLKQIAQKDERPTPVLVAPVEQNVAPTAHVEDPVTPKQKPASIEDLAEILTDSLRKALYQRGHRKRRYSTSSSSSSDSSSSNRRRRKKHKKRRNSRH